MDSELGYSSLIFISGACLGLLLGYNIPSNTLTEFSGPDADIINNSEEVVFNSSDLKVLNKVFSERRDEYGFCFSRRSGNKSIDLRHPSKVYYASEKKVRWSCPYGFEGIIHTHPGGDGGSDLSELHKNRFLQSDYQVTCVMNDVVRNRIGGSISCYSKSGNSTFRIKSYLETTSQ